jgi:hypothetical protein
VVRGGSDKFIGSDLEQRLKDRGIKTGIVTSTSAQGAVAGKGRASRNSRNFTITMSSRARYGGCGRASGRALVRMASISKIDQIAARERHIFG